MAGHKLQVTTNGLIPSMLHPARLRNGRNDRTVVALGTPGMVESAGGTVFAVIRTGGSQSYVAAPCDTVQADGVAETVEAVADTRQNAITGGVTGSRWSEWALMLCLGWMLGVLIVVNFPAGWPRACLPFGGFCNSGTTASSARCHVFGVRDCIDAGFRVSGTYLRMRNVLFRLYPVYDVPVWDRRMRTRVRSGSSATDRI